MKTAHVRPTARAVTGLPVTVGVADQQLAPLAYAAQEAQASGCSVRLVHAYVVPPAPADALGLSYGIDVDGTFREAGREILDAATAVLAGQHPGLKVGLVLEEGSATKVLTQASHDSPLLVIGPDDDIAWYSRLFLGKVARNLVEKAGCPVVVVPGDWRAQGPADKGVTLLIDSETVAHGPLCFAFEHAARHGDLLNILHVHVSDEDETVPWHDMNRLIGKWNAVYPHVRVDTRVVNGTPDLATVETFENTGLLVLGRPHEPHPVASVRRSLASSVIKHARCPVAVVPADYDG